MTTPCPLCNGEDRLQVHDRARGGEARSTGICTGCALVQFDERPSPKELARLYASGAFSEDARGSKAPDHKKLAASDRAALKRYRRLLRVQPEVEGPALEVGCGLGSFLFMLRGHGLEVDGIEPDPTYAKLATKWHNVPTKAALLEDVKLPPAHYGLVALFHVLEHMHDPLAALQQLRAATRDDGTIYIEVPSVERPYGGDLDRFFWAPHLQSFSTATLEALLTKAGFAPTMRGHSGDFLWMVARAATPAPPELPAEDPVRRVRAVRRSHAKYLRMERRHPATKRIGQLAREAKRTLEQDPEMLLRAAQSKAGRLGEEVQQATARRLRAPWVHYAVTGHAMNSGDTVLFDAVRDAIGHVRPRPAWDIRPLRRRISPEEIDAINKTARAVVVGGGGLFLRDTVPDSASGWQWNIAQSELEALQVPLIVYAVGYNRFRGQDDFDAAFQAHVEATVARSAFFGLRNHGSIESIKTYLPDHLHDRVRFQPCPTTVLNRIRSVPKKRAKGRRLSINVAFDRQPHRFQDAAAPTLEALAHAALEAHHNGWTIDVPCHTPEDEKFAPFLEGAGVPHNVVRLYGRSGEATIQHYAQCDLAIGMRGHAQMIPFGLGVPIMSLVSHEKMQWFLDDIKRPEWGVELLAADMADRVAARISEVGQDAQRARDATRDAQEPLWRITQKNTAFIESMLEP